MNKPPVDLDNRLLDYLDGKLDDAALRNLKTELENSPDVARRLEEFRIVHESLSKTKLESPSTTFTARVMQNLHRLPVASLSPRNGLLLLAGMLVAILILLLMTGAGNFDNLNGVVAVKQLIPEQKYFQFTLPTFSINGKLVINLLVGINLVLAFIILDRTILRPFFQRRAGAQF